MVQHLLRKQGSFASAWPLILLPLQFFFKWTYNSILRTWLELTPLLNKLHLRADCLVSWKKTHLTFAETNPGQQCKSFLWREVNHHPLDEGLRKLLNWRCKVEKREPSHRSQFRGWAECTATCCFSHCPSRKILWNRGISVITSRHKKYLQSRLRAPTAACSLRQRFQ